MKVPIYYMWEQIMELSLVIYLLSFVVVCV